MSINELTNEEVLFSYFSNKEQLERYNTIFEIGGIEDVIDILDAGRITIYHKLSAEELEELYDDLHYKSVKAFDEKIAPIALIIEETDPSLFRRIQEAFLNSIL